MTNFDGIDEIQRNLDQLQKNVEKLKDEKVTYNELFPSSFLERYTNFISFDDMLAKSGFKIETMEDFANIPAVEWDAFIALNTRFANWEVMQQKAYEEHVQQKLGI